MSARGGMGGPVASVSRSWPDVKRVQSPTASTDALYSGDHCPLNTSASIPSLVIPTYEDLYRAQHT